jgi:sec-independent protein translocase protein TatA
MLTGILQPTHLIILLAVALIVLGPKRLPHAGRALGQGLREFKDSVSHEPSSPLPEGPAHEEAHPIHHDDTAPVRREETPPVQ